MRWGKALLIISVAGLFLLLLSALVVSPETPEPCTDPAALTGTRLLPMALPAQETNDLAARRVEPVRALALMMLCLSMALPVLTKKRDANGRILQAARYENSFYLVFRQEVAGG